MRQGGGGGEIWDRHLPVPQVPTLLCVYCKIQIHKDIAFIFTLSFRFVDCAYLLPIVTIIVIKVWMLRLDVEKEDLIDFNCFSMVLTPLDHLMFLSYM